MAFPLNPTIGDTHVMGSKTYKWDGTVWSRSIDGLLTTSNITETDGNVFYSNTRVRNFLGNIDGALVPSTDEGFSLGTDLKKWSNLFLSGNTIVLGNTKIQSGEDGSISIRSTNTQVTTAISFASNGYIAAPSGPLATASGSVSATPRIANVRVTDNSYNYLDDTAANSQGYVEINGASFDNGATVIIGTTTASSVTFVNSTRLRVGLPTLSAGTYPVYVVNSDGSTATRINGLNISGTPLWTTASGFVANVYESNPLSLTINAVSDSNIFYSVVSGSLPPSSNLNPANGYISNGNTTLISGNTVYNFTVNASDVELQNTTRAFSISVLNDVVIFNNTFTTISLSNTIGNSVTVDVSAINLANTSVSYSSNSLPGGLVLNSNGIITGSYNTVGNTTSVITATAGYTLSNNTKSLLFSVAAETISVCYLAVGGGGTSYYTGGGGGGGGFLSYTSQTPLSTPFCISIGAGRAAVPAYAGYTAGVAPSTIVGACVAGGGYDAPTTASGGSGCPQNVPGRSNFGGGPYDLPGGAGAGGPGCCAYDGPSSGTVPWGGPGCTFTPTGCTYAGGGGTGNCGVNGRDPKLGRDGGGDGDFGPSIPAAANRGGGGAGGRQYGPYPCAYPASPGGSGVAIMIIPDSRSVYGGTGLTFTCTAIPGCKMVCFTAGSGCICIA